MNTIKTFFLLMVMTGLLLLVGAIIGGEAGIILALIFALVMNVGAYWFSDKIALGMTHASQRTEAEDPELYHIVAEQASLAGMPMPKVYEIETESPNAFATGRNPSTPRWRSLPVSAAYSPGKSFPACWPTKWPTWEIGTR